MSAQDPFESGSPLLVAEQLDKDGSTGAKARRKRRRWVYLGLMVVYVLGGMTFYFLVEGWAPSSSLLMTFSILTGVGYGHIVPASSMGSLFTSFYILAGLVLFASIAGQILDSIVASQVGSVLDTVKATEKNGGNTDMSYCEKQAAEQKRKLMVSLINLGLVYLGSVLLHKFCFGEDLVHSIYMSSVSVFKLDSVCLADTVVCSKGWHTSSGGERLWISFAIFWYVLTYGTVGHFVVSATSYLGVDPEATVTRVHKLTDAGLESMDKDGDGHVTRDEFLRERLIQDKLCDAEHIDAILANFDELDKDKSGHLNKGDASLASS